MHPFGYHEWDEKAIVLQSPVPPSAKKLPPPANVKEETTPVQIAPSDGASETTGTVMRETKFDTANYPYKDLLLRAHQINDPEIPLCDISNVHVYPFVQSFRA